MCGLRTVLVEVDAMRWAISIGSLLPSDARRRPDFGSGMCDSAPAEAEPSDDLQHIAAGFASKSAPSRRGGDTHRPPQWMFIECLSAIRHHEVQMDAYKEDAMPNTGSIFHSLEVWCVSSNRSTPSDVRCADSRITVPTVRRDRSLWRSQPRHLS
jgi:hypothetical protein